MLEWIRSNLPVIALGVTLVGAVFVANYRLQMVEEGVKTVSDHRWDSTKHLDPIRDPAREKEIRDSLERLEMKLDRLETRIDRLNRIYSNDWATDGRRPR